MVSYFSNRFKVTHHVINIAIWAAFGSRIFNRSKIHTEFDLQDFDWKSRLRYFFHALLSSELTFH